MNQVKPETIEIEGQIELADYLRANLWVHYNTWGKALVKLVAIVIFFALASFLYDYLMGLIELLFGLFLLFIFLISMVGIYLQTKLSLKSHKQLQETIHYKFYSEGFEIKGLTFSGQNSWVNIIRFIETKHIFMLFVSNRQMFLIPKRYFQNPEQLNAFRDITRSNLPSSAKMK